MENRRSTANLQSDGLHAYRTFINRYPELAITPASCLTHIARKFKETRHEHPRITARVLLLIGMIYQTERRMDAQSAHPLDRQRARWLESRKPYDHLRKLARRVIRFRGLTPGSGFYKALKYTIEQLPHLEACFLDGRIKFDITSRKTPFAPPDSATRTGYSSAERTPAGAARSSTPSSSKSTATEPPPSLGSSGPWKS